MINFSIRNSLTAVAFAALVGLAGTMPAAADVVYDDSYFDTAKGFAGPDGTAIEEASIPSHIQDAMEVN